MTRLLIVDDSAPVADRDQMPKTISDALGWDVATARRPDDLPGLLDRDVAYDLAMVDLSYANSELTGLDALLTLHKGAPACRLVVYTQGDAPFADMLRDAWDAFDLACALSKLSDLDPMLRALQQVARDGSAPVDPVLLPLLPAQRSPWRSLESYSRLVGHAGHAKLWRALILLGEEPSYRDLAEHTGLSIQSVRNYRTELLGDLALHYLDAPRMREMQRFAKRCRALLAPHICAKLGDGSV